MNNQRNLCQTLILGVVNVAIALVSFTPLPVVRAQPSSRPKFEVASIHRCSGNAVQNQRGGAASFSPGRITIDCQTVSGLIESAYVINADGVRSDPTRMVGISVEGAPGWADSERYTISATAAGEATQPMMEGPMLQDLLEDRFHLKIRRATRDLPIYELMVAKGGHKLKSFVEGSCIQAEPPARVSPAPPGQRYCNAQPSARGGPNMIVNIEGFTMEEYATSLSANPLLGIDRPVVDKTGLKGKFEVHIEFARTENALARMRQKGQDVGEPTAPALPEALKDQLGLELRSAKGSSEQFVIEHIERPSEN